MSPLHADVTPHLLGVLLHVLANRLRSSALAPVVASSAQNRYRFPPPMFQYVRYINQAQGLRSNFGQLPSWARFLVMLAAVPGIIVALLSILGLVVSIIALLLLTVPVYRLLQLVCFSRPSEQDVTVTTVHDVESPGRRQVEAKVIE